LEADLEALAGLPAGGMIVTARSEDPDFDFVSRYFAPAFGIPEDPVTGSAHCTLGPFWRDRLGKDDLRARQISHREGVLGVRVDGRRVYLGGKAVTVISGRLSKKAAA
jgi:predicted PhzF superfamily epimerase YddE/YHI9